MSRTAAISLSWKSDSQVVSSIVSMEPPEARPALWTTPSMRPQRAIAASTKASRSSARETSARCASTSPPTARTVASALRNRSSSRPHTPTAAPSAANCVASASPSPSVPPVMRTVLPVSSRSICHSFVDAVIVTSARNASACRCERRRTNRSPAQRGSCSASL